MQAVWDQLETLAASDVAVNSLPNNPLHSKKHRFIWPEPNATITQGFGPTPFAFEPPYLSYPHFHTGLDLADVIGTPVQAADDGVVVLVGSSIVGGQQVGYGNYVVIAHTDGLATLYGHLALPLVKVGDKVKQGQPIGLEGSTGNSTGPHCHFELRVDGQFIDPTPFLPPGPSADRS
jgi:murein DD-endopeptidase MepM/ murein hydrolase activator NlpD